MDTGGGTDSSPQHPCFPSTLSTFSGAPHRAARAARLFWWFPWQQLRGLGRGEGRERQGQLRQQRLRCREESTVPAGDGRGPRLGLNHQG